MTQFFMTVLLLVAGIGTAAAEGSRNLYPSGYTGSRANMDVSAPTTFYAGVVKRDMFVYVYAQAGEYILIGSRNIADNGDVRIYNPQGFGTPGNETVPGTVNFSCFTGPNAAQPGPHYFGGGRGAIANRLEELAGPNSADNTATVSNGFSPCAYRVPTTGIYGVSFRGGASGGGPNGVLDPPALSNSTVSAWDITVRATATSLTDLSGRAFTYAFTFFTGGNSRPVSSSLYYVTLDGFRYRQDLRGFDPNGYALYANTLGFLDNGQPLYKDIRGANATLEPITPAGTGVVAQGAQFPLFFSDIDPASPNEPQVDLVLAALGVSDTPPNATLTGANFTGSVAGNTSVVNAGGTFSFDTTNTVTFQIVISRDGVDFDPANVLNRVITGVAPSGPNSAVWDGLDNSGVPFPVGSYSFRIYGRNGEVHFPMIDSEGNTNGGSTITRLNGPVSGRTTVYYDDRGYVTRNGTAVGTLNGFICGASPPVPPSPDHDLIGVDSNANVGGIYYRAWVGNGNANADCDATQGFGDAKGLDLWTYVSSTSDSSTVVIVAPSSAVDVATTVSVPATAYAGTSVFGAFSYRNDGTNNATGVAYTAVIGTPGSCPTPVSFTIVPAGVTATHNAASCAVTFTGMPATLTPGQQLDFAFSYTAPVSGTIPLSTTISAGNETPGAPAPNSAGANTVIVSPRLTLAKSAAPASYGAVGQTINYSFLVTNVGSATLDGPVTVSDPLVSNESCPALSTIGDFDARFDPGEQILCSATYVTTVADLASAQIVNSARAIVQSVASPFDTATLPRVLIDAVDDNFTAFTIDGVTGGTTPTVYSNDTANGSAFAAAAVTPSIVNSGGLTGVTINADGSLNVPPGTPAGTYNVVYRICLVSNPNTCDTATATVAIAAVSAIDAVNNDFSGTPIDPTAGGNTATVFTNDRLNGAPFAANQVIPTLLGNGGLTGLVLNASGTLTVPAGTTPGTYYASYRICNVLAPAVCDDAQAIIVVSGIDAVNDDFSSAEIASTSGGVTPSVFTNDTLAGVPIKPTAISASITNAGGLTGVSINANGTLNVPPGTPAGSYGVTYQICLVANPSVCDTAVATVVVVASPSIDAVNNDYTATPFGAAGGNTPSVYLNDTLSGAAFSASQVTSSIVSEGGLIGVSINPDGTVSVPPSAAPGTYNVVYEICSVAAPALCDQAIASITVINIDAVNDDYSLDPIDGSSGGTTATLYSNDTVNGSSFLPASVSASITALGGLPVGTTINASGQVVVPAGTAAGSYTMTYQICVVANPSVCDSATAIILVLATTSPELNVTKTVNPNPVVTNGPATYTITVTNTGSTTTGNITITDQLRPDVLLTSFSGSNWNCTGTSLVECVYSSTLLNGASTQLQLVVDIGPSALSGNNTARASGGGDPGCPAPPSTAKPRCFGSVLTGTVPVTLSDVEVVREGAALVVRFGTASEAGTLAYRVLSEVNGGRRQPLSAVLTPGKGASLQPQRYEVRGDYRGQNAVWIVEIAIDGEETAYGPFAVGSRTGERVLSSPIDWAGVRAEQASFRLSQARAIVNRSAGSAGEAELRVSESGLVRVSHADLLAQGIDWTGVNPQWLQLSRGQTLVPLRYEGPASFGSGSSIVYYAEAVSGSLYTKTAVYRLRAGSTPGASLPTVHAAPGTLAPIDSVTDVAVHAPNREYSFSSPTSDPWYAQRVVRVNAPSASSNENFSISHLAAPNSAARIEVELWGGLDFPEGPDHSIRLLLNGTEFASRRFDGLNKLLVAADLPAGLLQSGNNILTLELVGDTGIYADIVHLEAIRVQYLRRLVASDNRLSFSIAGTSAPSAAGDGIYADGFSDDGSAACRAGEASCQAYAESGLTRSDVTVLRLRGARSEQLGGSLVSQVGGAYELRFASQVQPGDRYWIAPASGDAATVTPAQPLVDPLAGGPASYLIIAHPSLISGLSPLVAARQAEGFSVRVLDVEDLYRRYSAGTVDPNAISDAIADAWQRLGTRYVLLVGSDSYDYFNIISPSLSLLPTHYRNTGGVVRYAPADSAFADTTGDGLADVAIGRFPVRTLAELGQAIDKTLRYAQASHGRQLLNLSDRDQATLSFAQQMQTIPTLLGGQWTSSSISLRDYASGSTGVAAARADLASAVNAGKSLLAFFGHSSPTNWTRESLLTAALVQNGLFSNTNSPTAVWQLGCWGAYFVDPQAQTLAHSLMLQPGGGAALVLGASSLTAVSSDATWMQAMTPLLGSERVGDALRLTQRLLRLQGSEFNDISVGATLLGDPALRLRQ